MRNILFLIPLLSLMACTSTSEPGTSPLIFGEDEKAQAAKRLNQRFEQRDLKRAPIFSLRKKFNQRELEVIADFADALEGAAIIVGGYPSYYLDIEYRSQGKRRSSQNVSYTVFLREVESGRLISTSKASEPCLDTKSVVSLPAPCDFVRYKVLEAALFGL